MISGPFEAGLVAVVPLALALVVSFWNAFGPSKTVVELTEIQPGPHPPSRKKPAHEPDAPPAGAGWVLVCAGLGWLVACPPIGGLNPFLLTERWMILGIAWVMAIGLGLLAWRREPLEPATLGAAALAVLVNLLAAGGIGIPAVAMGLWIALALALNLREDRPCGKLRETGWGRVFAFGFAACWVALLGTFVGAVTPYWRAEAAMADAADALGSKPPLFERAEAAYLRAKDADRLSARPWLALAALEYAIWDMRGAKPDDLRWRKIPVEMAEAAYSKHVPNNNWTVHRERAKMSTLIAKRLGDRIRPQDKIKLLGDAVQASRIATQLYPTNAMLHAWLAESSAEVHMYHDALAEGAEALRLDAVTPHADRKLDPKIRLWIESNRSDWEKAANTAPDVKALQEKLQGK